VQCFSPPDKLLADYGSVAVALQRPDVAQERAYYSEMRDLGRDLTGIEMTGMGGPGPQAATENTVDILAELGFLYHGDWFLDDQPFPLNTASGRLIAMPYSVEINDSAVLATAFETEEFADIVKRQFDRLYAEGAESVSLEFRANVREVQPLLTRVRAIRDQLMPAS